MDYTDVDTVSTEELAKYLSPERAEKVRCEQELPSTNSTLMEMLQEERAADGQVVIADRQSAGRGRVGKSFASPGGMGIYLSYLIRPSAEHNESAAVGNWLDVTCRTAVAVSDAIYEVYGVMPQIKWVNDLYLNGRKLCGILTQTDIEPSAGLIRGIVAGIGVNVSERGEDFPKELRDIATSLYAETGRIFPRAELAAAMIRQLDDLRYKSVHYYLEEYRRRCPIPGKKLILRSLDRNRSIDEMPDMEEEVTALSISDTFGLVVLRADGTVQELRGEEILRVEM